MKTNRRNFIKGAALVGIGTALQTTAAEENMSRFIKQTGADKFELPPLGYAFDALEPFIDAQTMQLHYAKHHQAYVNKLNEALEKEPSLKGNTLEALIKQVGKHPESVRSAIRNHGGGHWNHTFFWTLLKKGTQPGIKTTEALQTAFGSVDAFKKEFEKISASVFGSGWAWLIIENGKLRIVSTPNQDNTLMDISPLQGRPIIGLDVWEHAYYLKYQNKRADYIQAFWNVLNWDQVEKNMNG
jgi:Fe-Mn family superoxide dismutase